MGVQFMYCERNERRVDRGIGAGIGVHPPVGVGVSTPSFNHECHRNFSGCRESTSRSETMAKVYLRWGDSDKQRETARDTATQRETVGGSESQ